MSKNKDLELDGFESAGINKSMKNNLSKAHEIIMSIESVQTIPADEKYCTEAEHRKAMVELLDEVKNESDDLPTITFIESKIESYKDVK